MALGALIRYQISICYVMKKLRARQKIQNVDASDPRSKGSQIKNKQ